jgi:hypothetical protein
MAESVDLLSLERFYLPVNIPETYRLFEIDICASSVGLWFLPEEYLVSEETTRIETARQRHFLFSFTRGLNMDDPMAGVMRQHGISEADLIDGKYLFREPNSFSWGSGGERLHLYTPRLPIVGLMDSPEEPVRFTEVYVLDLTSEDAIKAILEG